LAKVKKYLKYIYIKNNSPGKLLGTKSEDLSGLIWNLTYLWKSTFAYERIFFYS